MPMHAITVAEPGGPEQLQWTEIPTPEPGPGEVRIRVAAAGVNRADLLQRQGHYPPPAGVTDVIGLEAAGVIDQISPAIAGTTGQAAETGCQGNTEDGESPDSLSAVAAPGPTVNFQVGDEVIALLAGGGYAEYAVVPLGQCAPRPAGVPLTTAAGIMETSATVVSNFDHIGLRPKETILIHGGAGGIGSFAIPYAHRLGARVITTVGSESKAAYARSLGADVTVDYHDDWEAEIKQATGRRGVDAILDIIGAKYLEANVRLLARGGRMVVIGLQGGTKGTLDLNRLLGKAATITATSLRFRPESEKTAIVAKVAREVWPLFSSGAIPLPEVTTFPMAEAGKAHQWLESGQGRGKTILIV